MNQTTHSLRAGIYEKALPNSLSWQEKLSIAKSLNFDFVEISVDETEEKRQRLDWSDDEIFTLRHLCESEGIFLHSMCLSAHRKFPFGSADPEIVEHAKIIMQKALILAYKLGIRVIQLAGYDVYYEPANEETHLRFIEGMKWCAKQAERMGIMLAVEIMDTEYLNSLTKFEQLRQHISSPFFMAYPDVGNINGWNYDVCAELSSSKDHVVQIHLKDTLKVKDGYKGQFRDLVIGEGEVNFDTIFETLANIKYQAPFVIEMWAQDDQWKENILIAQKRLSESALKSGIHLFNKK